MQTQVARAMFQVYEPIVLAAGGSNTPENQTICKQLGLGDHRMSYYAVSYTHLTLPTILLV